MRFLISNLASTSRLISTLEATPNLAQPWKRYAAFNSNTMKLLINILFFLISTLLKGQNFDSKEELKVYNTVFVEIIGKEYYYEEPPIEPISLRDCKSQEDSTIFNIWKTKFNDWIVNPKIDTSNLVIAFNSTLIYTSKSISEAIKNKIKYTSQHIPDSVDFKNYTILLETLIDCNKYSSIQININDLSNTGRFELRNLEQFRKDNPSYTKIKGFRLIGDVSLSRVCFNKEFNKGVFYMDFVCGGDCGSGIIFLISKINGEWIIKGKIPLWVS